MPIGWPSRSNAWPTMPCGARCGTRPWPTAGRPGRKPWRSRPTARPWGTSSRRSVALAASAGERETLEQAIDLRLALRSALIALGDSGRYPGLPARGRNPRRGPRRSRRLGQVSAFCRLPSVMVGDMTRPSPLASVPSLSPRLAGMCVSQVLANQRLGIDLPCPGGLSSGHRLLRGRPWHPSQGESLHERFGRASFLPRRAILPGPDSSGALPSWGRLPRAWLYGEEALRIAEAVDHPDEPYHGVFRHWSARPPPGRPAQGTPSARTGRGICQDADMRSFVSPRWLRPWAVAYTLVRARRGRRAAAHAGVEQTTAMDRMVFSRSVVSPR